MSPIPRLKGRSQPQPTSWFNLQTFSFISSASVATSWLGLAPAGKIGRRDAGEFREHESTAWVKPPPVAGQAESRGRGNSGVRTMGNLNSQVYFRLYDFPSPYPSSSPNSTLAQIF